jgi:hypothetical protein
VMHNLLSSQFQKIGKSKGWPTKFKDKEVSEWDGFLDEMPVEEIQVEEIPVMKLEKEGSEMYEIKVKGDNLRVNVDLESLKSGMKSNFEGGLELIGRES